MRLSALRAGRPSNREVRHQAPRTAHCRAVRAADMLQGLLSWAESNKIATDKVTTSISLATDAPLLVAARDIPAGEAILVVPDAHWVSTTTASKSPISQKIAGLEPWLQLALLLLHERATRAGAAPAQFVASLPATLDTPLFWADDEIDMLQGTQLLQQLYGYRWVGGRMTDEFPLWPKHGACPACDACHSCHAACRAFHAAVCAMHVTCAMWEWYAPAYHLAWQRGLPPARSTTCANAIIEAVVRQNAGVHIKR